jgi:hypothetical protein
MGADAETTVADGSGTSGGEESRRGEKGSEEHGREEAENGANESGAPVSEERGGGEHGTGANRVLAALGGLAVLGAFLLAVAPGLVPSGVRSTLAALSPGIYVALLTAVGFVMLLVVAARSGGPSAAPLAPEPDQGDRPPALGERFDRSLDRATDPSLQRADRLAYQSAIREWLQETGADAVARAADCDREVAARLVADGAWTGDRRASALLGDADAPAPPWYVHLWDLLRAESAFARRVRHAVDEIRAIDAGDREVSP